MTTGGYFFGNLRFECIFLLLFLEVFFRNQYCGIFFLYWVKKPFDVRFSVDFVWQREDEGEFGSMTPLWLDQYIASELHGYHFGDMQPEPYALSIHGLGWIKKSKELEELWLVLILDSNASISDRNLEHAFVSLRVEQRMMLLILELLLCFDEFAINAHLTTGWCEFYSVWLDVQ